MNDQQIALNEALLKAMRQANRLSPLHANKSGIVLLLSLLLDASREESKSTIRAAKQDHEFTIKFIV